MRNVVYGIFTDEAKASRGLDALDEAHFDDQDIQVHMHSGEEGTATETLTVGIHTGVGRGAVVGGVLGALTSTIFFTAFGIGVAPVLILGTLAGGGLGATVGAFFGMGQWRDEIEFPERPLRKGVVLISVFTRNRVSDAYAALHGAGAKEVRIIEMESTGTGRMAGVRS